MSLNINLNQAPYYDDYSELKDFHRVLFRPGFAVQARELTQLQTILQKQAERLGLHLFKDGSRVYGGELTIDVNVKAIKIELTHNGTSVDIATFQNKYIVGGTSGARARVRLTLARTSTDQPTLIVQLLTTKPFLDGETITAEDNALVAATTVSLAGASGLQNAQSDSSMVSISEGSFFISGFLVRNAAQSLVLEKYNNTPTYRVGLEISEELVSSSVDNSLLDNAQGAYNYAAPGADRLKLSLTLTKVAPVSLLSPIDDNSNERFVQLVSIQNGLKVEEVRYPIYGEIEKTLARRTFDESGNYTVRPFNLQLIENVGGNTSLVSAGLEPGKAYVRGFEFETISTQYLDIEKGRNSDTLDDYVISTDYGNKLYLNKMHGVFDISSHQIIDLHCVNAYSANAQTGTAGALDRYNTTKIGTARIRSLDFETADLNSGNTTHYHSKYAAYIYDIRANNKITGTVSNASNNTIVYLPSNVTSNVTSAYVGAVLTVNTNNQGTITSDIVTITEYIAGGIQHAAKCNTALSQNVLSNSTFTVSFKIDNVKSIIKAHSSIARTANPTSTDVVKTSFADVDVLSKYNRDPNGNVFITDTNRNSLIYKLPYSPIKTLTDDITYVLKRKTPITYTGTSITFSDATGGTVQPTNLTSTSIAENFIVAVIDPKTALDNQTGEAFSVGQILSFDTGSGRSISTSGSSVTINLNCSSEITVEVIYATRITSANRSKAIVAGNTSFVAAVTNTAIGQVHISSTNVNKIPGQKDNLMISDVFNIVKIVDSQSASLVSLSDLSDNDKDITDRYTLDTGQKDNYYDHASIILKPGQQGPAGSILVIVDYFNPDTQGGYFSVDSYPTSGSYNGGSNTFGYSVIPDFVSPSSGENISLRDVIDFRPVRSNANNDLGSNTTNNLTTSDGAFPLTQFTSGGGTPDPETTFTTSIEYYLSRIDKVTLTKDRKFKVLKGVDALNPVTPADDDNSMTLYTLTIPAYTFNVSDILTRYIDNKRYTMRDIGKLERRIENLEYYTSLSLLEKETAALDVSGEEQKDSLFNPIGSRFKNGILVDSFSGHSIGDTSNEGYKVSIDFANKELRPSFISDCFIFDYSNTLSSSVSVKNNIVTLPYSNTTLVTQPLVSTTENINEFGFLNYIGNIKLSPFSDVWYDQTTRPDILVNIEGQNDGWKYSIDNYGHGTQWNDWSKIWSGKEVNDQPSISVQNAGDTFNSQNRTTTLSDKSFYRLGIKKDNIPESIIKLVGNKVIDVSVVPYIREQEIFFAAKNMKPNQNVYSFFDGVDVSSNTVPADILNINNILDNTISFIEGETVTQGSNTGIVLITDKTTSSGTASIQIRIVTGNSLSFTTGTIKGLSSNTQGQISSYTKSTSATQANTDAAGQVSGSFTIGSSVHRTGDKLVRLSDSSTNNLNAMTTVSEASFRVQGVLENKDEGIISTRYSTIRREQLDNEKIVNSSMTRDRNTSAWLNPMAQTFYVNKSDHPDGIFVNSVDLFFYSKNSSTSLELPVTLQLRPVSNRLPSSSQIIPFSEVTLHPDFVNVITDVPNTSNSDHITRFTFGAPVYLPPDEYALVILTNSDEYILHAAKIGDKVTGTTKKVSEQPNVGIFYKPQNSGIWEPTADKVLTFNINRCNFDTTATGNLVLISKGTSLSGNTANVYFDEFKFIPSVIDFANTTTSYSYVSTNTAGSTETTATSILPDQQVKLLQRRMVENNTNGDIKVYTSITTNDSKLSPVLDIDRFNIITIENVIDNGGLTNADIIIVDGGANYNSSVTATVSGGGTTDTATLALTLDGTGAIETCTVTSGGSGYITTPTVTISDASVANGTGASIKIKGETDNDAGNLNARYITRRVTLEDGFDASDIKVILRAYKPQGSNILVYTKVLNAEDSDLFDDKEYILMDQETSSSVYSLNNNDFVELTFKSTNDSLEYVSSNVTYTRFKTFAIKICMLSNSTLNVPKIRDMRAIALDE